MREEADLEALIARIQSDLRSGRSPAKGPSPAPSIEGGLRSELRAIHGRPRRPADFAYLAARRLAPAAIFAAVLIAVLLFDKP